MSGRKWVLLALVVVGLVAAAALSFAPPKPNLLLLDWASKAKDDKPPSAVLIEMGLKDDAPTVWSSRAVVTGAKVVHREGYRFREDDKLTEPDGWEASSRHAIRAPKGNPAAIRMEGVATVGVVLHLADVAADAVLTIDSPEKGGAKAEVPLKEVLEGKTKSLWDGAAVVRLVTTAVPLVEDKTEDDFPAAAYGPDGTLWVAYIAYRDREENRRAEQKDLKEQPENFKALYTPEYADQLFVKYYREGKWSDPIAVTEGNEDLMRCAIAVRGDGVVWVIYSAHRKGRFDIYAHALAPNFAAGGKDAVKVEVEQQWTNQENYSGVCPTACTDQAGIVWTSFQRWRGLGQAEIAEGSLKNDKPDDAAGTPGKWITMSNKGNCWRPSLTAPPEGEVAEVYDAYVDGDYDILQQNYMQEGAAAEGKPIAASPRFEARPSACYDAKGRLWIAYEEGPEKWGKDSGALAGGGNPLYNERSSRVVCLEDGKLMEPTAELPTSVNPRPKPPEAAAWPKAEKARRYTSPTLGLDGKGRLWLVYREKFGTRNSTIPGSYWISYARRLDGDHWTDPVEVTHSDGLLDYRPVLLPHPSGGLLIVHNTDGRYTTPEKIQNRVYVSAIDLPGDPAEPKLKPRDPGKKVADADKDEKAAVKRIRDYRIEAGGKKYQLLRGDFHRHTEISWDGGADGSLEDLFRYAIDAAAFDWIGCTDHDNGNGREYPWWLTQKDTDAYFTADHFTPMFTYERSVPYPHGHRNVMFDHRGVRTLPRLAAGGDKPVAGVSPDDTKMLYRYLKEMDGLCASHTSATGMGTDWRDNDPALEPIVEIYQGDRNSYEYEGAPRAGYDPKGDKKPVSIGGWEPKGFIDLALGMGYKFGFESSSDHWSTHISYSVALAEKYDRAGILDAFKKRHCYAATDNIILDVRCGEHVMGDSFKSGDAAKLQINVIGTDDLAEVAVLKDSKVVEELKADGKEYKGTWTDAKPMAGTHYYYVRVTQKDKALAWGSPMWIETAP